MEKLTEAELAELIPTPNWLKSKCRKVINLEKRITWDIKGPNPDRTGACCDCPSNVQKKCKEFNWAGWINKVDLQWEQNFELERKFRKE